MSHNATMSPALGTWWGYAEGDATAVGLVVLVVAVLAVAYVAARLVRGRRPKGRRGDDQRRTGR